MQRSSVCTRKLFVPRVSHGIFMIDPSAKPCPSFEPPHRDPHAPVSQVSPEIRQK
jgi:hypothetical protein